MRSALGHQVRLWCAVLATCLCACGDGGHPGHADAGFDAGVDSGLSNGDAGPVCPDGACPDAGCALGEQGCACAGGSCDPGLSCEADLCVDGRGMEGGPCLPNNSCNTGNRCDALQAVCVHCDLGSAGCQCGAGDACADGLACYAGTCVDGSRLPPANPRCYTPCRSDVMTGDDGDETLHSCDSDGLIEGCLEGKECSAGSCVSPGADKPTCESDLSCPFFQTCLAGGCYSNCETDADCGLGRGCHAKVCRVPCTSQGTTSSCPEGESCDASDGENGYCTPIGTPGDSRGELPEAGFRVSTTLLDFSNVKTRASLSILTDVGPTQDVTVRKTRHKIWYEDGHVEEVVAPRDPVTGDYAACDPTKGECPLFWLQLGHEDDSTKGPTFSVRAPGDCESLSLCPSLDVSEAGSGLGVRWEGELELCSGSACSQPIFVTYFERPDGQWTGTLHYFGTFEDDGLSDWLANRDRADADGVQNALIKKWAEFRNGGLTGGWDEFQAILTATREGSWAYGTVKDRCQTRDGACYPYTNTSGVRTYSDNLGTSPIPTGQARFPIAMNLRVVSGGQLDGRIASDVALQYAGNPRISLSFDGDPTDASACDSTILATGDCAMFMSDMVADIVVGGRYYSPDGVCDGGYAARDTPWLVDGFTQGTVEDDATGLHYRTECLDAELPFDPALGEGFVTSNVGLAGGNPIPDGRERERNLTLIDGALINQSTLFVLFQESFESFIPGEPSVSAYGYMVLTRKAADVADEDFLGYAPPATTKPVRAIGVSCEQDILDRTASGALASDLAALSQSALDGLVDELINGPAADTGAMTEITSRMHVFCEDTGLIDGGAENMDGSGPFEACPPWSKVTYFSLSPSAGTSQADIAALACNAKPNLNAVEAEQGSASSSERDAESCHGWLMKRRENGLVDHLDPYVLCDAGAATQGALCDDSDRLDMLRNKRFYVPTQAAAQEPFQHLLTALDQAFRYKTRFQSDDGDQLGFAPRLCIPDSDEIPYCYEPSVIEETRGRVDCLIDIYTNQHDGLSSAVQTKLNKFLRESFSRFVDPANSAPVFDGFERLYAELLIMLGDEALAGAFASRFDLAGSAGSAFEGSLFEQGGIDLTGVAGYEMTQLYSAVQHYQLALDRLYLLGPNFRAALDRGASTDDSQVFVSPATVTDYLERLTRAATQKARAWGEIAKRYQEFNRPHLAQAVTERAYTATYLESVVLSNLMTGIKKKSIDKTLDQIRIEIEKAQLRYRVALLNMRDIHEGITDAVSYFGFAPDYIPFPALDAGNVRDTNAYEVLALIARQRLELAKQRELTALDSARSQKLESASFQSELVRVRNTYENQLADLCGTFQGADSIVYPATSKYAYQSAEATLLGNPCGLMGNGQISDALGNLKIANTNIKSALTRYNNIIKEMAIEGERLAAQCDAIRELADAQKTTASEVLGIQSSIAVNRALMTGVQRQFDTVTASATVSNPWGVAAIIAAGTAANIAQTGNEIEIAAKERVINRVFESEVYRSHRMRDRPLVNTLWELVINQRDEQVNRDIDLQSLSDIRLLLYYTDFTAL